MKILRSKDYSNFDESRQIHRRHLVRFIRIGLSILLIVFAGLRIGFKITNPIDYVMIPLLFLSNLLFTTLTLRKKLDHLISSYLSLVFVVTMSSALEITIMFSNTYFMAIFYGLMIGIYYTMVIVSKLPIPKLLVCSFLFYSHVMARLFINNKPTPLLTPMLFSTLWILLNYVFVRQEIFEFEIWQSLDRSHKQLLNFQELIQVFPSKILVFARSTNSQRGGPSRLNLLYKNKEVSNFIDKVSGKGGFSDSSTLLKHTIFDDFLKGFQLDCSAKEKQQNLFEALLRICNSGNCKGFESFFATFSNKCVLSTLVNNFGSLKAEEEKHNSNDEEHQTNYQNQINARFEVKIGSVRWGQQEDSVIVVLNDISKSEKIRELRILHQNKDKLLATVSHELRTPLNGIIGMLDVAEEKIEHIKGVRKFLRVAKNSARTLLLMINDILDVSQIERGTLRLTIETLSIDELIKQVLPLIRVQTKQKGLELTYENHCPPNTAVKVDRIRFQQIMLNLLSNAAKFTKQGSIKVRVYPRPLGLEAGLPKRQKKEEKPHRFNKTSFEDIDSALNEKSFLVIDEEFKRKKSEKYSSKENQVSSEVSYPEEDINIPSERSIANEKDLDCIEVSVEDTGIGINQQYIPKLFQLFSKLEHGETNTTGVGLGLAISQKLANQMKISKIKVRSKVGSGSRFWFTIPTQSVDLSNKLKSNFKTTTLCSLSDCELDDDPKLKKASFANKNQKEFSFQFLDKNRIERTSLTKITQINNEKNKKKILVVDDDQINHIVISEYLKASEFCDSTRAYNGLEAFEIVEKEALERKYFDLIIMDCNMPVLDGFQSTELINQAINEGRIPFVTIVALTANVSASDKGECIRRGMSEVWTKPVQKAEFLTQVHRILGLN